MRASGSCRAGEGDPDAGVSADNYVYAVHSTPGAGRPPADLAKILILRLHSWPDAGHGAIRPVPRTAGRLTCLRSTAVERPCKSHGSGFHDAGRQWR